MIDLTGVFIAAAKADRRMYRRLPSILYHNLGESKAAHTWMQEPVSSETIVVKNIDCITEMQCERNILIVKMLEAPLPTISTSAQTVVVVDSAGDVPMLEQVSKTMLPAITCGLSARDTITLSSIEQDSAVITLQRSVACFSGEMVEPQEIPIRLSAPIDTFTLTAAAATFIVTGNIEKLKTADFSPNHTSIFHS